MLGTFSIIFGIVGLQASQEGARGERVLGTIGAAVTAIGLIARASIAAVGMLLFTGGWIRSRRFPVSPFLLVLVGGVLLGFEEVRYGVLLAIRNDQPMPGSAPLTLVRWLVAIGYALSSRGWMWLGVSLARGPRSRGTRRAS